MIFLNVPTFSVHVSNDTIVLRDLPQHFTRWPVISSQKVLTGVNEIKRVSVRVQHGTHNHLTAM